MSTGMPVNKGELIALATVTARYYLHVQAENHRGAVEVLDTPVSISRSGKTANKPRMKAGKGGEKGLPGPVQVAVLAR